MANYTLYHTGPTGQAPYWFPMSQSLADWATYRVALTEAIAPNLSRYSGTVNDTNGLQGAIFYGATQPADWGEAIEKVFLHAEKVSVEVVRIPRAATELAAGANTRRTKVAATSSTLDETLGATP